MKKTLYIIDAFTDEPFGGNPAAVVLLPYGMDGPDDARMQQIAVEMNLSETAFVTLPPDSGDGSKGTRFGLRWFTPAREVDLCGHATLASAHALYDAGKVSLHKPVEFETRSGLLRAAPDADWRGFWLDLPATPPVPSDAPGGLLEAMGLTNVEFVSRSAPPEENPFVAEARFAVKTALSMAAPPNEWIAPPPRAKFAWNALPDTRSVSMPASMAPPSPSLPVPLETNLAPTTSHRVLPPQDTAPPAAAARFPLRRDRVRRSVPSWRAATP